MRRILATALGALVAVGCSGGAGVVHDHDPAAPPPKPATAAAAAQPKPKAKPAAAPAPAPAPAPVAAKPTPAPAPAPREKDAPQISRSVGEKGGVVVLWPRVIPRTRDATTLGYARAMQKRLAAYVKEAAPGKTVDVRPEPERVCPRQGCTATPVGAVLTHVGGGCAAIVSLSSPGKSPQKLHKWAGKVDLKRSEIPFRAPGESEMVIQDAVPCGDLVKSLDTRKAAIVAALKAALGG